MWKDKETAITEMRSLIPYADIIKISDKETELLTGEKDPYKAAEILINQCLSCVLVTLGSKGALVTTKKGQVLRPATDVKVVGTTGAGDSFMGGFLYCICKENVNPADLCGDKLTEFVDFANAVASLCVQKRGGITAMPTLGEVKSLLK